MANEPQASTVSPRSKKAIIWLAAIALGITALPAMGIVLVFMALFAPAVVPFWLAGGTSEAKYAHT